MKEISAQLVTVWLELKLGQKVIFLAIVTSLFVALGYLLLHDATAHYTPLYANKQLTTSELNYVRTYLTHSSIPFLEDKEGEILVLAEGADEIRNSLVQSGISKNEAAKGFELFDTNTWIKGEKELQVLEMRALKGQLERDLATFEPIKNAQVILDIPPQRSFNGPKNQPKASVILTLMPQVHLTNSVLRSITNHLTGAVRGLEPHMIAIADTTGKLYKALDPTGKENSLQDSRKLVEEEIDEKISTFLQKVVGCDNFHTTLQVTDNERPTLLVAVAINKTALPFHNDIEKHLSAIMKGCSLPIDLCIDLIPFETQHIIPSEEAKPGRILQVASTLFFVVVTGVTLYYCVRYFKKKKREGDDSLFRMMTRVDLKKLSDSIQGEDPHTIALMLSYLEPNRAEQMLASLQGDLQEKVLFHLTEIEREGS